MPEPVAPSLPDQLTVKVGVPEVAGLLALDVGGAKGKPAAGPALALTEAWNRRWWAARSGARHGACFCVCNPPYLT